MTSWPDHLPSGNQNDSGNLSLFEIAHLLLRFDHVACFIVNADKSLPKTKETFIHRAWTHPSDHWKKHFRFADRSVLWKNVSLHFSAQLYRVQRSGPAEKGCQPLREQNSPPQQKHDGQDENVPASANQRGRKAESRLLDRRGFRNSRKLTEQQEKGQPERSSIRFRSD
jgi:hypothetical protein